MCFCVFMCAFIYECLSLIKAIMHIINIGYFDNVKLMLEVYFMCLLHNIILSSVEFRYLCNTYDWSEQIHKHRNSEFDAHSDRYMMLYALQCIIS